MRIACLGGGPAGLYFAIAMKLRDPRARDRRGRAQPALRHLRLGRGAVGRDARQPQGRRPRERRGDPPRVRLLGRHRRALPRHRHALVGARLLRHRPQAAAQHPAGPGAARSASSLRFETEIDSLEPYRGYDLIVAADGANSKVRGAPGARLQARHRRARLQVHLARHAARSSTTPSPSSSRRPSTAGSGRTPTSSIADTATFIVECSEATWRRVGFDRMSQEETIAACERIFARNLGGHRLMTNARHLRGSAWLNFNRVLCETWSHEQRRADGRCGGDRAFLGRLRHQAGARERHRARRVPAHRARPWQAAFRRYEDERRTEVLRLQSAARNSTEWFEQVERYLASRSRAVQLFAADALAAHQPREPAHARQGVARRRRDVVRGAGDRRQAQRARGRRCSRRSACASCASRTASWSRRWRSIARSTARRPTGTSCTTPSAPRAAPGLVYHRDDLRLAGGAHHARLHRALRARARGGLEAHRRFHPCRDRRQDRHPARPLRPQGLDPARLGDDGRAARAAATGR